MTDREQAQTMQRIAYGDETTKRLSDGTVLYHAREADRCPDCQVQRGELHEEGCDVEQCPICNRQHLACVLLRGCGMPRVK